MFKVTKTTQWNCKGNMRNYIKYMRANTIEEVIKHFGLDNILEVEECEFQQVHNPPYYKVYTR